MPRGKGLTALEYDISDDLQEVIGTDRCNRPTVIKKLWAYIKRHELQGTAPGDRTNIYLDSKLQGVFGVKKKITMFQMNSLLSKHLTKI